MTRNGDGPGGRDPVSDPTIPSPPRTMVAATPARAAGDDGPSAGDPAGFELGAELARGGMGRIVAARDLRLGRPVAVKQLLLSDAGLRARFEREAHITARLQHPGIVPVYEAGQLPSGEPFFAMKLVSGRSLDKVAAEARTLAERLALLPNVTDVVEALAYAHSQRVIHRDLKPANVLVGQFGETVVIDWGLAKDLSRPADPEAPPSGRHGPPGATGAGEVMGTPAYMPREQALGEAVDERADVYALGALLYHVLGGEAPYDGKSTKEVLDRLLAGPPSPLAARAPGMPEELLAIVAKAMAPRPGDRYPHAGALAEDLRRFQTGHLVGAHAYTRWQLARRWLWRHRMAVAILTLLAAGAASGLVILAIGRAEARHAWSEAVTARAAAEAARAAAEAERDAVVLAQATGELDRDPTRALAWLARLSERARSDRAARAVAADGRARGVARVLRGYDGVREVRFGDDGRWLVTGHDDGRLRARDLVTGTERTLRAGGSPIRGLAVDASVVVATTREEAMSWDLATGATRTIARCDRTWGRAADSALVVREYLVLSPDLRRFLCVGFDGTQIGEVGGGAPRVLTTDHATADFSADGTRVISLRTGELEVWDAATGALVAKRDDNAVKALFLGDATQIAYITGDTAVIWDLAGGTTRTLVHPGRVEALGYSPRTGQLVTYANRRAHLWDVATGASRAIWPVDDVEQLLISEDGSRLALVVGASILVKDLRGGSAQLLRGHTHSLSDLELSADGARLATASRDGTIRIWDLGATLPKVLQGPQPRGSVWRCRLSPDGRWLVTHAQAREHAVLFDTATGAKRSLRQAGRPVLSADFSPDGKQLALLGSQGEIRVVDTATGVARTMEGQPGHQAGLRYLPDGRLIQTDLDRPAGQLTRLVDPDRGDARAVCEVEGPMAILGRSGILASTTAKGEIWLCDPARGTRRRVDVPAGDLAQLEVSADGARLLLVDPRTVRVIDTATGAVAKEVRRYDADWAELSPDGRLLALFGKEARTVRLWDLERGVERTLHHGARTIKNLIFSADGKRAAASGDAGDIWSWELSGSTRGRYLGRHGAQMVTGLELAPDDRTLYSVGVDGSLLAWSLELPATDALDAWIAALGDAAPDDLN